MPRILYMPMFSSPKNLATCSTMAWSRVFFEQITNDPDVFVYFALPEGSEFREPWMLRKNVHVFRVPMSDDQYEESFTLQDYYVQQFGGFGGVWPVDVVITDKAVMLPKFRVMTEPPTHAARRVYATNLQFDFTKELHKVSNTVEALQSIGLAESDVVITRDDDVLRQITKVARRQVTAKHVSNLLDRNYTGGYSFDEKLSASCYREEKPPTPPLVLSWAYAMTEGYHFVKVMEGLQMFMAAGHDVRMLLTTPSRSPGAHTAMLDGYSFLMSVNYSLPREKFLEKLNTAHAFVFWPNRPGFSGSLLEQMAAGLLGVFHRVCKPPLIPDDYPFLFSGTVDLPLVLAEVVRRYNEPEVTKLRLDYRQKIFDHFSGQKDAVRLWALLKTKIVERKQVQFPRVMWMASILKEVLPPFNEISFTELRGRVQDRTRKHIEAGVLMDYEGSRVSIDVLRDAMLELGWKDTHDSPDPIFSAPSK